MASVSRCANEGFGFVDGKAAVLDISLCVGCGKCVEKMCSFDANDLLWQMLNSYYNFEEALEYTLMPPFVCFLTSHPHVVIDIF